METVECTGYGLLLRLSECHTVDVAADSDSLGLPLTRDLPLGISDISEGGFDSSW